METYKLVKNNGDELILNDFGKYYLLDLKNFGNPNINYTSQRGYFQDGLNITNFVADPRNLSFEFLGQDENLKTRMDFWNLRRDILSFLSPVSGSMKFQVVLEDHRTYELTNVYPTNGLAMAGNTFSPDRNDGRISETLNLTAFDPIWRVAKINTSGTLSPTISNDLTFPITFPIKFGVSGANFSYSVDYEGTWRSYPKITIQGPYSTASLSLPNGVSINLIQEIGSTEQRIIDLLDPVSGFTVTDQLGTNKIGEINIDTNFTQFYFSPDTDNTVSVILDNGSVSSSVSIEWYTRYLGI